MSIIIGSQGGGISVKSYSTAQRLKQIMVARNLRQVDILKAATPYCKKYGVQLEKNALSQYVSGKVEPGQEKLSILGMALKVSEAWLMGYDVPMQRSHALSAENVDEGMVEFVEQFSLLSKEQRDLVMHVMKGILSAQ